MAFLGLSLAGYNVLISLALAGGRGVGIPDGAAKLPPSASA